MSPEYRQVLEKFTLKQSDRQDESPLKKGDINKALNNNSQAGDQKKATRLYKSSFLLGKLSEQQEKRRMKKQLGTARDPN